MIHQKPSINSHRVGYLHNVKSDKIIADFCIFYAAWCACRQQEGRRQPSLVAIAPQWKRHYGKPGESDVRPTLSHELRLAAQRHRTVEVFFFFFKWFLKMIEFQTCVLESRHAMRPFLEETKVHPGLKTRFWLKGKWLHSYVGMQIGLSCQIHKSQWDILSCFLSFANWSSLQIQTFFFFF